MSKSSSLRAVQRGVNNKPTIKGKRERERDHHPATLILKIEGVTEREGPPPSHPHLKDRRRDSERVYEIERVLMCVARLTASREATLGSRVSE